jgi:phosphotransferase system enzyme I (PtsI)
MCGEMASEPVFAMVLLGLGLDEFSASAVAVPEIKKVIRSLTFEDAKKIAEKVLTFSTPLDIKEYADGKLQELMAYTMKIE